MPNWAYNNIRFEGNPRTLQRLFKLLKSEEYLFDFNKIIPCPEKLKSDDWQSDKEIARQNVEQYGYEGWYDWNVAKWGTKWQPSDTRFENGIKGRLVYCFDTAYEPPTPVIEEIARRFPSLEITHEVHEEAGLYPSFIRTYRAGGGVFEVEIDNINLISEDEEDQ